VALAPMSPGLAWKAANDDLLAGQTDRATAQFRRLLEMDPRYSGAVFATSLRALGNPQNVVEKILPGNAAPTLKLNFINDLMGQQDEGAANQLWNELVSSRAAFPFSAADPYLEKLIASGQIAQAKEVWQDMVRAGTLPGGWNPRENAVYNGGFEWNPVQAGFDWRAQHFPYVGTTFGDPDGYQGQKALRIDYTYPENEDSEPVFQLVPVEPGRTYRLSAWVRSEDITSDSGPRLRASDPANPSCLSAETAGATGTTTWHEVSVTFSTCPATQLIRLSIWRPRSYEYPNDISGHFWVDDVKLAPASATRAPAAAEHP
jgi:hypothetical protein